jgi:hypothetical protein
MGSQGVLVLKALYFEMPEEGGLEVKLQANKPAGKFSIDNLNLQESF